MKHICPDRSGRFHSQGIRGCWWWILCQEWHLLPSLEFQRLVQPVPRLAAHGGPAYYIFSFNLSPPSSSSSLIHSFCLYLPSPLFPPLLPSLRPTLFLPLLPPYHVLFPFPPTFPPSIHPVTVYNLTLFSYTFISLPSFSPCFLSAPLTLCMSLVHPIWSHSTTSLSLIMDSKHDAEIAERRDHLWSWEEP